MPIENRSNDADGWIACDDGLHLIQMDKKLSHYGWVFRKVDGGLPYSIRETTSHEMAHAQARQHLRIGVAQIAGQAPAPQPHPEPIAWMVGTAIWWTKEEAERDAAATGLQIVGLGPMTGSIPTEQSQGIPVGEVVAFGKGLHEIAWAAGRMPKLGAKLYTSADPGEVERLSQIIRDLNEERDELGAEAGNLRAQQAETIKLITWLCNDIDSGMTSTWHAKLQNHLDGMGASAEPEAPGKQGAPLEAVRANDIQDLLDRAATAIGQYGDSLLGRGQREDSVDLLDLEREVRDLEQEFRGVFALPGA